MSEEFAHVFYGGKRRHVSSDIMEELGLENGQPVCEVIHTTILVMSAQNIEAVKGK